jgi:hypothetical protein
MKTLKFKIRILSFLVLLFYTKTFKAQLFGGQIKTKPTLASLYPSNSVFCIGPTIIIEVVNPSTGKIWMDRNLGAIQAATSSTDANSYGDLYQWGRRTDGHQCRNSAQITTLSTTDQPAHGNFIVSSGDAITAPYADWRTPQNNNLWQGVNGINNPCPLGFRIPTEAELDSERLSWATQNSAGAFTSVLKLPLGGWRIVYTGKLSVVGAQASYWSSTIFSPTPKALRFDASTSLIDIAFFRAHGVSVRCIKN